MRGLKLLGAGFVVLSSCSGAWAAKPWAFDFKGFSLSQFNAAAPGISLGLHVEPQTDVSGTLRSPGGVQGTFGARDTGSGVQMGFSDFAQFEALNATPSGGTWTMNAVSGAGTSVYHFTADFSGVDVVSVPQVVITSPLSGGTADSLPTFTWDLSGQAVGTVVSLTNADFSVNLQRLLPADFTSFTVPADLGPGEYTLVVESTSFVSSIPIGLTLESGPDLDIRTDGTFQFATEAIESFVVLPGLVPEPGVGVVAAACGAVMLRRRRGR